ncbi:h domain protein [Rhodococcus sp. NPDC058521]|uniref:h domain protein n=1 Tax=Rhodococcus sp. NPDC058521 TaxID=3346536 RepID=UPI00364A13CF
MTEEKSTPEVPAIDSASTDSASTDSAPTDSAPTGGKNTRKTVLASLAGVLVLVLVGLVVWQGLAYREDRQVEQTREEVVDVAGQQAVAMLAYNFDTAEDQLTSASDGLTGSFREDYTKLINDVIVPGAQEKKLTVQVTVQAGGVISAEPEHASVLLYLNQITTSADAPEAKTSGSRVKIGLDKVDGRWLVNNLEPV